MAALRTKNTGIDSFLNPMEDLAWKKECNSNSWFAIGHFNAEGHTLNFLYHLMIYPLPTGALMNSVFSVTDETTGEYFGEDHFYPMEMVKMKEDGFGITVPDGCMEGDMEHMTLKAWMEKASIELDMVPSGDVIYNGGTGIFPVFGIRVHQYSIPGIQGKGTITIDGKSYDVDGLVWFDRQWQQAEFQMSASSGKFHWTWMDINLDCGEYISLWSTQNLESGEEHAWATVLHKDGTQTVAAMEPMSKNESQHWKSPATNQNYPTHWKVVIPELDAVLEVAATPKEQEIVSKFISKYEAASKVTGTYMGKDAAGYCYVELVGMFQ